MAVPVLLPAAPDCWRYPVLGRSPVAGRGPACADVRGRLVLENGRRSSSLNSAIFYLLCHYW